EGLAAAVAAEPEPPMPAARAAVASTGAAPQAIPPILADRRLTVPAIWRYEIASADGGIMVSRRCSDVGGGFMPSSAPLQAQAAWGYQLGSSLAAGSSVPHAGVYRRLSSSISSGAGSGINKHVRIAVPDRGEVVNPGVSSGTSTDDEEIGGGGGDGGGRARSGGVAVANPVLFPDLDLDLTSMSSGLAEGLAALGGGARGQSTGTAYGTRGSGSSAGSSGHATPSRQHATVSERSGSGRGTPKRISDSGASTASGSSCADGVTVRLMTTNIPSNEPCNSATPTSGGGATTPIGGGSDDFPVDMYDEMFDEVRTIADPSGGATAINDGPDFTSNASTGGGSSVAGCLRDEGSGVWFGSPASAAAALAPLGSGVSSVRNFLRQPSIGACSSVSGRSGYATQLGT
ncbi:hypothetical protein Vafri_576, partial [Volvox africanus]